MDAIELHNIGKRFNKKWIFRDVNASFESNRCYALMGSNGSGKSTLLQILSSFMLPSEGKLSYTHNGKSISVEEVYHHLSISAPYLELIEEFSLSEVLQFHQKIKGFRDGLEVNTIIDKMGFKAQRNKSVKNFSSGMKQRLKLALAIYSPSTFLLLDEPCANLDQKGIDWYQQQLDAYQKDRLILICSNHKSEEIFMCDDQLIVEDYA